MSALPTLPIVGQGRRVDARLRFAVAAGRTHLGAQYTPHPFHITRPFHIDGDPPGMATLYLQSSAGGVYGDDALGLDVALAPRAQVHLTTQASTVVHPARGGCAEQRVGLDLGAGALLEYCPDPAILFAGARLRSAVSAQLAEGAQLLLCDAQLCHDPEGQGGRFERYEGRISIHAADAGLIFEEVTVIDGDDWASRTGQRPCHGTVVVAGLAATRVTAVAGLLRQAIDTAPDAALYGGVSAFEARGVVVGRMLAGDGHALSLALNRAWQATRRGLCGVERVPPRRK
jgi:urease accessory protein